ncbi:FtsK/SpoIIIE family DNA translocase [Butyrivibrio sp. AC2005]|uniref:FtsK/SpoIIIE family DNA translocase n=1 Tax=Butyrivibrio sp. AC2005 TaxID=1280672 RepID=UPI0004294A68|nr:DNA translocase FtsK [Butyrivibrio sp. AC2005]
MTEGKSRGTKNYKKHPNNRKPAISASANHKSKLNNEAAHYYREITIVLLIAFSAFMFFSTFGLCGRLGNAVSNAMFGLFGLPAYFVPIIFGFSTIKLTSTGETSYTNKRVLSLIVMLFSISMLLELMTGRIEGMKYFDGMVIYNLSKDGKNGGGFIAGVILYFLYHYLSTIGSLIVILVLIFVSTCIFTKNSIICFMKKIKAGMISIAKRVEKKRLFLIEQRSDARVLKIDNTDSDSVKDTHNDISTDYDANIVTDITTYIPDGEIHNDIHEICPISDKEINEEDDGEIVFYSQQNNVSDSINAVSEESGSEEPQKNMNKNTTRKRNPITTTATNNYEYPSLDLLHKGVKARGESESYLKNTARILEETMAMFNVTVKITHISQGPSVTRYELHPEAGVKVRKIVDLADDIKMHLAATDIRIEAPIPGKSAVGIEVPNKENSTVALRNLIESEEFQKSKSKLSVAIGKDIAGKLVVTDIAKMPHLLIAGATGSGKSVCINTIIMSIIYKASPEDVRLIMIDPKIVELSVYNGIPHLLIPVVTDPKKAAAALNWAVAEMTTRYKKFANVKVRDLKGYNTMCEHSDDESMQKMPEIVVIVDELADLMMQFKNEVEDSIVRLTQLARAAGIYLIIATQRPSVDVITGLIKANIPSRIAFAVSSGVDSRTILDSYGAEKLIGKGDMLFFPRGYNKPARVQGCFVSDDEVQAVTDFVKNQGVATNYGGNVSEEISSMEVSSKASANVPAGDAADSGSDVDPLFAQAGAAIIEKEKASIGMLQRQFKIGFNRAARIMDQLCDAGVVSPEEGTKPRRILVTKEEFDHFKDSHNK